MGLDMYLYTNSKKVKRDAEPALDEWARECFHDKGIAMYWRKANAIHQWFVEHVQNGEDDCGTYEVSVEQLQELRDTCMKVLESCNIVPGTVTNGYRGTENGWEPIIEDGAVVEDPSVAMELLPTQEGFFFGGTDYDEWYIRDIADTAKAIALMLSNLVERKNDWGWSCWYHKDEDDWRVEFQYHSSW